jgi:hypothetical protein
MATGRELVSNLRSTHRLLSTDSMLSDRAIFSELRINTFLAVRRETNLRKLWATDTLFTTIPCLEMIEVPISECCDYVDNCTVSRSKFKIPKMSEGNYQYLIQGVYSINAMGGRGKKLKEITINRYLNLLKLPIIKNEEYYWIVNNYLYTNNPLLQALRISAFFEEDIPNEILFPDCDCNLNKYTIEQLCQNPLDKEFQLPGYLEKQVLDMTSQKLLSTYYRLKQDQTTNNVDGQAPNTQPTE